MGSFTPVFPRPRNYTLPPLPYSELHKVQGVKVNATPVVADY